MSMKCQSMKTEKYVTRCQAVLHLLANNWNDC